MEKSKGENREMDGGRRKRMRRLFNRGARGVFAPVGVFAQICVCVCWVFDGLRNRGPLLFTDLKDHKAKWLSQIITTIFSYDLEINQKNL